MNITHIKTILIVIKTMLIDLILFLYEHDNQRLSCGCSSATEVVCISLWSKRYMKHEVNLIQTKSDFTGNKV